MQARSKHWLHVACDMPNSELSPCNCITQQDKMWTGLIICTHKSLFSFPEKFSGTEQVLSDCLYAFHSTISHPHTDFNIRWHSWHILCTFYTFFRLYRKLTSENSGAWALIFFPLQHTKSDRLFDGSGPHPHPDSTALIAVWVKHSICTSEEKDDPLKLIPSKPFMQTYPFQWREESVSVRKWPHESVLH